MSPSSRALRCTSAALLAGASVAVAQPPSLGASQVYRIVGPDGKITYSDRAPTDERSRASLVNRPAASGAGVMPPPVTAITPWASLSNDVRRGIVPPPAPGAASGAAPSPTEITEPLVDALSQVLARAEIVETMRASCVRAAPSASSAYSDAWRQWQNRNSPVVAQAYRVMMSAIDGPRRAKLYASAHTRISNIQLPLASASPDARIRWCDQSAESITAGALDLQGPTSVAASVMAYPAR